MGQVGCCGIESLDVCLIIVVLNNEDVGAGIGKMWER